MKQLFQHLCRAAAALAAGAMLLGTALPVSAAGLDTAMQDAHWAGFVEESIALDKTPGLSVAAVQGDHAAFRDWGDASTNGGDQTPFGIGSCTKAFTALGIFVLQEEGRLSIEDSVSDYLPWWHVTWQDADADVKIWMLLDHCAGIPDAKTMARMPFGSGADMLEQTARVAQDLPLVNAPGEVFAYSNLDYDVLAYLIQTVSGIPFPDFIAQEIFTPIGMTHSGFDIPTVQGRQFFFGSTIPYDPAPTSGQNGSGGMITTSGDMALWMQAQLGMRELPDKLTNAIAASHEASAAHAPRQPASDLYYNGWIHGEDGSEMLLHSGYVPTFCAMVLLDPATQTGVFAVADAPSLTPSYAAYALFADLTGRTDGYPTLSRHPMRILDLAALIVTAAAAVLLVAAVVLLVTQKKRIASKRGAPAQERGRLVRRCIGIALGLTVTGSLPYLLGAVIGYPGFGYRMIAHWAPHSLFVCQAVIAVLLIVLAAASVRRYRMAKDA